MRPLGFFGVTSSLANLNLHISCCYMPLTRSCLVWSVCSRPSLFVRWTWATLDQDFIKSFILNPDPLVFHSSHNQHDAAASVPPHRDGCGEEWRLCIPPVMILRLLVLSASFTEHMFPSGPHTIKLSSAEHYSHCFCSDLHFLQDDIWSKRSSASVSVQSVSFPLKHFHIAIMEYWLQAGRQTDSSKLFGSERRGDGVDNMYNICTGASKPRQIIKTDTKGKVWVRQKVTALGNVSDWPNNFEQLSQWCFHALHKLLLKNKNGSSHWARALCREIEWRRGKTIYRTCSSLWIMLIGSLPTAGGAQIDRFTCLL